jgi:DNA-binding NarL/FixJ family response regulator
MSPTDLSTELVWVFAVDDQRPFREAARRVVDATAGFAWAGEAGSGEEAVSLVRVRAPDIVIMDVRMPDMDGIEAARLVAAECPDVTVLLVSAEPLASPAADLLRSRAAAFARKQNFGPALLRMLKVRGDVSATPGCQP